MIIDKTIPIQNIYYMLSYAFQALKQIKYEKIAAEAFGNIYDLFAEILYKGISHLLKQGLRREYVMKTEDLSCLRGKLDFCGCTRNIIHQKRRLSCEYDELSENHIYHQILKTTVSVLTQVPDVDKKRKKALQKLMLYFADVETLDPRQIRWDRLHYDRHYLNYEILMHICRFVLEGWLQTTERGQHYMMTFLDDQMPKVYEKFILEYYRRHRVELGLTEVRAKEIPWDVSDDSDWGMNQILPKMRTDITLCKEDKVLIVDAKYYTQILSSHYERQMARSSHLYQMYAYVNNLDTCHTGNVAGLLLYAKTKDEENLNCHVKIGGHRFGIRTLDLNQPFEGIKAQLNHVAATI